MSEIWKQIDADSVETCMINFTNSLLDLRIVEGVMTHDWKTDLYLNFCFI